MSSAAMQARSQPPASSSPYTTSPTSRRYAQQSPQGRDPYYAQQAGNGSTSSPSSRKPVRQTSGNGANTSSPLTPQQYYTPSSPSAPSLNTPQPLPSTTHASPVSPHPAAAPAHGRHRSAMLEDPPVPPPRTSSNQPRSHNAITSPPALDPRVAASRRDEGRERESSQRNNGETYLRGEERDRPGDDVAAERTRRKGRQSPEGPHRASSTREHQSASAFQSRSEAAMGPTSNPPPLSREESEVISRVVVTDPQVDVEREQERAAEAVPTTATDITPVTGLSLVGSEGVDDGGRGGAAAAARRQTYNESGSKRRETKFGEYMLGQTLGEGEFGKVKLGWKRDGSVQVAIKLIRRESVATNPTRLPKIYREISILRELSHPNIVRLHEMVETDRHIGIILEYASGGELFDYILNHRYLKDPAARRLFAQLVSGVGYLHKKGIVHRDLKLENLLLDRNRNIIITDFGFANTFNPGDELSDEIEYNLTNKEFVRKMRLERQDEKGLRRGDLMQTSCGSPCYAAPELVVSDSLYTGRKVDVWSCGVILYAMLAGYLPFDDDPANPEGDNINLLYKYIVSTPLTFPEYVTPHARDLLRRILVPDPRKRADLFEVARHSWLNEFSHVVSHITSSTTNVADIANSTVPADESQDVPQLARSASVREPSKTHQVNASPVGGLSHQQGQITPGDGEELKPKRDTKRRTVQVEYVAPQSQTTRGEAAPAVTTPTSASPVAVSASRIRSGSQGLAELSTQLPTRVKPLPQDPPVSRDDRQLVQQQSMPPPARVGREVPRSVSDSTGAFNVPSSQQYVTRPTTQGSMTSASGGRGDVRLPSRGSYGQPVPPTVAATNAHGKVAQPKNGKQYSISGPIPQDQPQAASPSIGRPSTQQLPTKYNETTALEPQGRGHKRANTLGGIGEKIFGRSGSLLGKKEKDREQTNIPRQQKVGKRYPPTSMKEPYESVAPRASIDSRRSTSFGFGRKKSDLEAQEIEAKPRRFSLLPASFSFKSFSSANKDQLEGNEGQMSRVNDFPQPPGSRGQSQGQPSAAPMRGPGRTTSYDTEESMPLGHDGQTERDRQIRSSNFPPRGQQHPHNPQSFAAPTDVYGGTGVYKAPQAPYGEQSYLQTEPTPPAERWGGNTESSRPAYPEGFNSYDGGRPSMQQGRPGKAPGVLQKNNRKFADAYDHEQDPSHAGSSGAARKVMDFFRRRGKARAGDDR